MTARKATAANPLPEPSQEQLALAYRHLANFSWPTTLEAAMAKQSYATALRQVARNLNRGAWRPPIQRPVLGAYHRVPPTPTQPPGRQKTPASSKPMDMKRAAANDRDDA